MDIRRVLSEVPFLIFLKMIPSMVGEYWNFAKHCARAKMSKNPEKLLTDILMVSHALEKGLSIHNKKKGFGVSKLEVLVNGLQRYIDKYGYSDKILMPLSVANHIIIYHKSAGYTDNTLEKCQNKIESILKSINKTNTDLSKGGYITLRRENMISLCNENFENLCRGRYSFRHFSEEYVSDEIIVSALDIAKKSPSACNRQSYRVHVYDGKKKDDVLYSQGGARSFYKEASRAIVVTADMERYFLSEAHLGYVDGALFAMSLIYALTYLGVASIPLTICQPQNVVNKFIKDFGIPENEYPVLVIAIGNYPDSAEISKSERYEVSDFTSFHL